MSSSSVPRWWSRLVRKHLLVAAAIGVLVLAVCAPALADEPASAARPAVPPDTTALARASIVGGRLDEALRILNRVIVSDRPEDELATAAEMRAVVDRWVALGATIAVRSAAEPAPLPGSGTADPTVSTPDAWESAFAVSRAWLVAGNFQDAGPGFSLLIGSARTQHQWQRAYALASLSSDLVAKDLVLRVGRAAPPAARSAAELPPAPPSKTHTHWYGWQTLIVDGVSLLVMPVMAAQTRSSGVVALAVGGYVLGGPIVHFAHGEVARGFGSLGLRVGLPFLGALGGAMFQASGCRGEFCGLSAISGAAFGGALGVLAALVIDPAALAYERVEDEPAVAKAKPSPKRSNVALSPLASPRKEGGFDVGLGGVF